MKVLVTGGAGYIGSVTANLLIANDYKVAVLDNLSNGSKSRIHKKAKFFQTDITNRKKLIEVFKQFCPDSILHFASLALVEESIKHPLKYYHNNVLGSYNLFTLAAKYNVKNIIFSSTSAVYGQTKSKITDESHPLQPINPYGQSKLITEKLLNEICQSCHLNYIILRYFNVGGASLDGSCGENHQPETHLIPVAISAALKNVPVIINGKDYPTSDGTCIRDYIHVLDLAEAHLLALEEMLTRKIPIKEIYNVGSGKGYSNLEIVKTIEKVLKKKTTIKYRSRRVGDPPILVSNISKIKTELNFKPKYSNLQTIIKSHHNWLIKNKPYKPSILI